jgi:hypothetical protein
MPTPSAPRRVQVGANYPALFIAPETVKKHAYKPHRKLGVENRVQLSYFVHNRLARRG